MTAEPPEATLLRAFVNTLDLRSFVLHGHRLPGGDALATPEQARAWFAAHSPAGVAATVTESDLELARDLRDELRAAIDPASAPPSTGRAFADLVEVRLAPGRPPALTPTSAAGGVLGEVVRCALALAQRDLWSRLKVCGAEDCHWVFYDRMKSAKGRWCSPERCGNRSKTRAYRARRSTAD